MEIFTSGNKSKGPIVDPGLCRCCGSTKKCRLLNVEYEWIGQKEIYSDMFVDTFGLLLLNLDRAPEDRLICATCVTRLRDASAFKKQVLCCEEQLLSTQVHSGENEQMKSIKQEACMKVEVNELSMGSNNTCEDYLDHHNEDDLPAETKPRVPTTKTVKRPKKLIKKEKTAKSLDKDLKSKRKAAKQLLKSMDCVAQQLEILHQYDSEQSMKKEKQKETDIDHKMFKNTITIVENSFVCPFDTSFSDYYCIYCREVYIDPNKLREHTLSHDPTTFKDFANKKIIQIDITRIDCRLCPETITDIEQFKIHISNDHAIPIFEATNEFLKFKLTPNNLSCIECGCMFNYFHALRKHMAEHFGTCICDVCGAHYFEERMLILHQKSHKKVDEIHTCQECGKTFKSRHSKYLHELKMHKKEPTFQCPRCDEVLFSYSLRLRHMIDVHGEKRLYKCNHCERAYDSRKSLREHNRRSHLKIFKHQCDLCDKRFYLPSRLREHMVTHTGERNFRCEYCGKSYPRLRGLKVHMQSHSVEKKFRCEVCSAAFTQNVNLKAHMKRQHSNLGEQFQE